MKELTRFEFPVKLTLVKPIKSGKDLWLNKDSDLSNYKFGFESRTPFALMFSDN